MTFEKASHPVPEDSMSEGPRSENPMSDDRARQPGKREGLHWLLTAIASRKSGELVNDLRLDPGTGIVSFRRGDVGRIDRQAIRVEAEDADRLKAMVLSGRTHAVLRVSGGAGETLEVFLADNRGGAHWGSALLFRNTGLVETTLESTRDREDRKALTIAHELRQPLFAISVAAERLRLMLAGDERQGAATESALARIATQAERAQIIISRTLSDSAALEGWHDGRPADLAAAARNSIEFLEEMAASANTSIHLRDGGRPAYVDIQEVALEQVFVNVLRNGIEAIQARREQGWVGTGSITVDIACDGQIARGIVCDNGAGLAEQAAASSARSGGSAFSSRRKRGFGLGLSICRDILGPIDGAVRLRPRGQAGTVAEITVPLAEAFRYRRDPGG